MRIVVTDLLRRDCWYFAGFDWFLLCVGLVTYRLAYLLLVFVWFLLLVYDLPLRLYVNSVVILLFVLNVWLLVCGIVWLVCVVAGV